MADMIGVFGVLAILGLAFPALLFVIWLSLPAAVDRARQRVARGPWRCLLVGFIVLALLTVPMLILLNIPGPGQFAAGATLVALLAFASIGAAGMAALLAERIQQRALGAIPTHSAFLLGATALELAVVFPVLGWLLVLPFALLCSLGATILAVVNRQAQTTPQPVAVLAAE